MAHSIFAASLFLFTEHLSLFLSPRPGPCPKVTDKRILLKPHFIELDPRGEEVLRDDVVVEVSPHVSFACCSGTALSELAKVLHAQDVHSIGAARVCGLSAPLAGGAASLPPPPLSLRPVLP